VELDRTGCTRIVLLTKKFAFKFPNFLNGFRMFLYGLLANDQECIWYTQKYPQLCPILFRLPLGLLVVMKKVRLMTDEEFESFDYDSFVVGEDYYVPCEKKSNSFGWLDDKPVIIDYGHEQ